MKTIVFARHAKSDWGQGLPDRQRPLNARGLKDAPKMGRFLSAYQFAPDLILSSPANRARTTAQLVAQELGYEKELQIEEGIYESSHGSVLGIVQDLPNQVSTAMVFGHNPTTENLLSFLLQMRSGITVPTCGMACLEIHTDSWQNLSPLQTQLKWFIIPRMFK